MGRVLIFSLLGSVGAMVLSAVFLLFPDGVRRRIVPELVSYATGTLLGAAFLGLIPAAAALAPVHSVAATVLAGVVLFFLLEKVVLWRHCHGDPCDVHPQAAPLLLLGDALHNFADGVMIAAGFLTSGSLGTATALAVIAHEVPQEVGDFAILLEGGYSRGRAFLLNGLAAIATLPGAAVAWFALDASRQALPHALALSAASFLYVAIADLMPGLHHRGGGATSLRQVALLLAGIATIVATGGHHGE